MLLRTEFYHCPLTGVNNNGEKVIREEFSKNSHKVYGSSFFSDAADTGDQLLSGVSMTS